MEGIIKLSCPNIIKHIIEHTSPIIAGLRFSLSFHCPINITTKRAVSTKSRPFVLKEIFEPNNAPRKEPNININDLAV